MSPPSPPPAAAAFASSRSLAKVTANCALELTSLAAAFYSRSAFLASSRARIAASGSLCDVIVSFLSRSDLGSKRRALLPACLSVHTHMSSKLRRIPTPTVIPLPPPATSITTVSLDYTLPSSLLSSASSTAAGVEVVEVSPRSGGDPTQATLPSSSSSLALVQAAATPQPSSKEERSGTGWRTFLRLVASAIRQQIIPGIVLILAEFLLLALYYWVPGTRVVYDWVAKTKTAWGFGFVAMSSSVFCGIIPWTYLVLSRKVRGRKDILLQFVFYAFYWAEHGCEAEAVYMVQGKIWGTGTDVRTLVIKTACDQFIVTPCWFMWKQSLVFLWKDCGFNCRLFRAALTKRYFKTQLPAVQVTSWMIWIPAAAIIYAMSAPLQIVMNNLVGCLWTLLLGVLSVRKPRIISATDRPRESEGDTAEKRFERFLQVGRERHSQDIALDVFDLASEYKNIDRKPLIEKAHALVDRGRASSF
jgi:hypothetical protein